MSEPPGFDARCARQALVCAFTALSLLAPAAASAHGGVVMEEDVCVINIGFYRAHFTVYQPETRASKEFCEDLPDTGLALFVLDYLHDSLREVPVDFRIVRDVTGLGRFARLEDVRAIGDLEPHTVFYQPPVVRGDGSLTVEYRFAEEGDFIGIVTAGHPSKDVVYTAVFPFEVGFTGIGWWPLFVAAILLLQIPYLVSSGMLGRIRARWAGRAGEAA